MSAAEPPAELDSPPEPAAPINSKVEITVGGHTVLVEGSEPAAELAVLARALLAETAEYARRLPLGFSAPAPDLQLAAPPAPVSWEDDD